MKLEIGINLAATLIGTMAIIGLIMIFYFGFKKMK
jgi:hypothetical protein